MKKIKAIYVSVWDGGTEIRTNCMFNPSTNDVTDIEQSEAPHVEVLDEEYVELPNGEKITNFTIDGNELSTEEGLSEKDIDFLQKVVNQHYTTPDQE